MRVCIDGRNLLLPHQTGIAVYAGSVARALGTLGHSVEVIGQEDGSRPGKQSTWGRAMLPWARSCPLMPSSLGRHGRLRRTPQAFRSAQIHFDLYRRPTALADGDPPDVVHWTAPLPLHWPGRPNIVTVHDLIPIQHPGLTAIDGTRWRRMLLAVLRRAAHIVTVSETVRRAVISEFGLPDGKVTNLYQPLDLPQPADRSPFADHHDTVYDLFVGTAEPRKNLDRIIAAHRASGVSGRLVIAGLDSGPDIPPLPPHVTRMPWLARPDFVRLMSDARMLLLPSLAEGFGLPVAEAMALGVPVITSDDRGVLAEVSGGAALQVDAHDVRSISAAIAAVASDPQRRARMADDGRRRARTFDQAGFSSQLDRVLLNVTQAWNANTSQPRLRS